MVMSLFLSLDSRSFYPLIAWKLEIWDVVAAKGGSDFSARGKSKHEVIRFCQVRIFRCADKRE
jgi:hypothetical protein